MPPKKDVVNANGMVDFYKSMPKKFLLHSHNPNIKEHKLNLPFRMLIIGKRRWKNPNADEFNPHHEWDIQQHSYHYQKQR